MSVRFAFLLPIVAAVAACASGKAPAARSADTSPDNSAVVLRGSELTGNLLDALRYRVPGMTVSYPPGECPHIVFRGIRSVRNQRNPTVYVDGTRMIDTCILQQINSTDVNYVELYSSGNTAHTAYERNPFGLIVVFRVRE